MTAPHFQPAPGSLIEIEGVPYPATNSLDQPVHATEAGVRNFWSWFSGSHATRESGSDDLRPLLYYPTGEVNHRAYKFTTQTPTREPEKAELFYLRVKAPLVIDDSGMLDFARTCILPKADAAAFPERLTAAGRQAIMDAGYDGVFVRLSPDHEAAFVFTPEQIKSPANGGSFDPSNPDATDGERVLYRAVSPEEWAHIQNTGIVSGGGNTFNGFDPRPYAFFGEALTPTLIAQGEDRTRRAEYAVQRTGLGQTYKQQAADIRRTQRDIRDRLIELGAPHPDRPTDPRNDAHTHTDRALKRLTRNLNQLEKDHRILEERGRDAIAKLIKKLHSEDIARGYSSVVLVTRPLRGGHRFKHQSGIAPEAEYGFSAGVIKLDDIVQAHYILNKEPVKKEVFEQTPRSAPHPLNDVSLQP